MSTIFTGEISFYQAIADLNPHQREFISATERNVAMVGGVGSGKSVALCVAALLNGAVDPGGFSLIGRLNMPALQTSTMKTFLELCPTEWGEWRPTDKTFVMENGHQYIFRHLDISDPKVSGHIKSMNLSGAYIDEATEISEEIYYLILSRVRRKVTGEKARNVLRIATNPAGQDWVWRNYFSPNRDPRLLATNKGITSTTFDNKHLAKEYVENMVATYPKDWAERYLYGSFADFSDLIYKEFTERTHTWDSRNLHQCFGGARVPPMAWPVILGIDIGSDSEHDPWAIALIAVGPDGSLYQFDEVYGRGLLIAEIASELHAKLAGRPRPDVAYDYANRQAALELAEHDIHGQPAIKEVRPGLFKVAQYMHIDARLTHPFTGDKGAPRYFIANNCRNTIREITAYKYAKDRGGHNTEDPAHESSHSPDAIRYALHTFRPLPEKMEAPKIWENPRLDEMSRLYWRDVNKAQEAQVEKGNKFARPKVAGRFRRPGQFQR